MADVMTDLNIRRGLSTVLFSEPGVVNDNVIIEEGCWYLCTDTAELFLGVLTEDGLILKPINGIAKDVESVDPAIVQALSEEIESIRKSLNNYATEQYVLDAIENHDNIAKKADVLEVKTKLEEEVIPTIQETIIPTVQELAEKAATQGWVQEQSFATETFVAEKISEIDFPEVDTSKFITTEIFDNALVTKANEVPFTFAKFITKPLGNFTFGENVINLSLAEILAKLLGLTDQDPNVQEPTEPDGIIGTIIKNQLPMYTITKNSTLEPVPYKLLTLTESDAAVVANEAGFYQIVDTRGNIIESGYQELQIANDEVYYVIALPKIVDYNTIVEVKAWNDLENAWTDTGSSKPVLTCDEGIVASLCSEFDLDISHIDTSVYTVWAMEACPDGSVYRFVINE